jgi:hypothetical protein
MQWTQIGIDRCCVMIMQEEIVAEKLKPNVNVIWVAEFI